MESNGANRAQIGVKSDPESIKQVLAHISEQHTYQSSTDSGAAHLSEQHTYWRARILACTVIGVHEFWRARFLEHHPSSSSINDRLRPSLSPPAATPPPLPTAASPPSDERRQAAPMAGGPPATKPWPTAMVPNLSARNRRPQPHLRLRRREARVSGVSSIRPHRPPASTMAGGHGFHAHGTALRRRASPPPAAPPSAAPPSDRRRRRPSRPRRREASA